MTLYCYRRVADSSGRTLTSQVAHTHRQDTACASTCKCTVRLGHKVPNPAARNPSTMHRFHPPTKWQVCRSDFPDDQATIVRLHPSLAFGSGDHPTTRLILQWLQTAEVKDACILDYGCGTGILGIAAALLGAQKVVRACRYLCWCKQHIVLFVRNSIQLVAKESPE